MANLSPQAVFSPSVARVQQASARDWNYVDSWLAAKFNRAPPPFERNADTLKALLALATANESADEEADLLAQVRARALQAFDEQEEAEAEQSTPSHDVQVLDALAENLTAEGRTALTALAEAGVALNLPLAPTDEVARKIVEQNVTATNMEQSIARVETLRQNLDKEIERYRTLLEDLQSEKYQASDDISKQNLDNQRKIKVLAEKLQELKDRTASLTAARGKDAPTVTIAAAKAEEDDLGELTTTVKELETQVKSFRGLPYDTDLARLEVERLREELRELSQQRDGMFEGLVERESPQKRR